MNTLYHSSPYLLTRSLMNSVKQRSSLQQRKALPAPISGVVTMCCACLLRFLMVAWYVCHPFNTPYQWPSPCTFSTPLSITLSIPLSIQVIELIDVLCLPPSFPYGGMVCLSPALRSPLILSIHPLHAPSPYNLSIPLSIRIFTSPINTIISTIYSP